MEICFSFFQKIVVTVPVGDDKEKQKAMKAVSALQGTKNPLLPRFFLLEWFSVLFSDDVVFFLSVGISSISFDMKEKKMTVVGAIDPVQVVGKLRKHWHAGVVTVGPKEEPKKDEPKKEEPKKEEPKKESAEQIAELVKLYKSYNPHMTTQYVVVSKEEDPNACVISWIRFSLYISLYFVYRKGSSWRLIWATHRIFLSIEM